MLEVQRSVDTDRESSKDQVEHIIEQVLVDGLS